MIHEAYSLTDAKLKAVATLLKESYLGYMPELKIITEMLASDPELLGEVILYGGKLDTCIRESILNAYSYLLVGELWPTGEDAWSEQQINDFIAVLHMAEAEWVE